MSQPHHIVLYGNGAYANRGCEAIVRGTVEILRHVFGDDTRFTVFSTFLTDAWYRSQLASENDAGIAHVRSDTFTTTPAARWTARWWARQLKRFTQPGYGSDLKSLAAAARAATAALAVGGDNYSNPGKYPFAHVAADRTCRRAGTPTVLWGASVGPFRGIGPLAGVMARHMRLFDALFIRETASLEYLRSIGVTERVHRVADPAFVMAPREPAPEALGFAVPDGALGVNLSPLLGQSVAAGEAEWRQLAVAMVERLLRETARPVLLVPHVMHEFDSDPSLLGHVFEALSGRFPGRLQLVPPELAAPELKWVISRCSAFAGARTHSTIAAIATGVPTVFLAYSQKAFGLATDCYGERRYCVPPRELTPDRLAGEVSALLDEPESFRATLRERAQELRAAALAAGPMLRALITETGDGE
jgi:colanic acid/amylovoran biosynthesis protein